MYEPPNTELNLYTVTYLLFSLFGLYMSHVESFYMKFYMTRVENNMRKSAPCDNLPGFVITLWKFTIQLFVLAPQAKILVLYDSKW